MNYHPRSILVVEAGSGPIGCSTAESDRDELAVFVETREEVLGLQSAKVDVARSQATGVKSASGDYERTDYPFRKFTYLASQGNPSILAMLWAPQVNAGLSYAQNQLGSLLRANRHLFLSKRMAGRFIGYMEGQKQRMTGERSKNVTRPELVEKHGYDSKFAYQTVRLGMEGARLLLDGEMKFPLPIYQRKLLMNIRTGAYDLAEALEIIDQQLEYVREAERKSHLPGDIDRAAINELLVKIQTTYWRDEDLARSLAP